MAFSALRGEGRFCFGASMDYSKFNFPAYKYEEFPKALKLADGSIVIVHNVDEEAVIAKPVKSEVQSVLTLAKKAE